MVRTILIFLILFGLPIFSANLKQSSWNVYARPVDQLDGGDFSGGRLWKKKPDWIDLQSNYWKILQNVTTSGNRIKNWLQPENFFRITNVAECRIRHWQFIPIRASVEIINQNLIDNLSDGRELELNIFFPHPSTFELIKFNLISEYADWEGVPRGWNKDPDLEEKSIQGYPAKLLRWTRYEGRAAQRRCRAIVDLPRYIRISADQYPCTSTKVVETLAEKLRIPRLIEQLGISEEERAKETTPMIIEPNPITPTPSIRLR
jgi:hypothetical protein